MRGIGFEDFFLVFKTNNPTAFKIKANGNIILKSLEGLGNGLVTIDNGIHNGTRKGIAIRNKN